MVKEVIVTGGVGYIGSHTVVELIDAGFKPVIIDDFRNSKPFILERIEQITGVKPLFYAVDCTNEDAINEVFSKHKNAIGVIHFAADKAVGESVSNPLKYYENNIGSLLVVLKVMKLFGMNNFVFSSSCTVYGEPNIPVVDESTPVLEAISPYGDTKIICEKIIRFHKAANPDFQTVLLRYFNPIGAHPTGLIGELPQGVPNNLLPYITQTAKGIREKLVVFGSDYNTADGTNIRDYIHVVDLSNAHVKAVKLLAENRQIEIEILNLGTGKGTSVLEIVHAFERVNNLKINVEMGARREGDVAQIYANADKAKRVLNWQCKYDIKDALKHAWNWEKGLN